MKYGLSSFPLYNEETPTPLPPWLPIKQLETPQPSQSIPSPDPTEAQQMVNFHFGKDSLPQSHWLRSLLNGFCVTLFIHNNIYLL